MFNDITSVEEKTFGHMGKLQVLWLSENALQTIRPGAFSGLDSLSSLNLQNNYLEALTAESFSGLQSLQILLLDGNQLTSLSADVFRHLPRPVRVALHNPNKKSVRDNPLQCDTDLCWLKQEELQGNITWFSQERSLPFKPKCVNDIDWDTWSCDNTGKMSNHFLRTIWFDLG